MKPKFIGQEGEFDDIKGLCIREFYDKYGRLFKMLIANDISINRRKR